MAVRAPVLLGVAGLVVSALAGCGPLPPSPGSSAAPTTRDDTLRDAEDELERARIACTMISDEELRAVGVRVRGVDGRRDCSWGGTRVDGPRADLEIGIAGPDRLLFRIDTARRAGTEVTSTREADAEVTLVRYRTGCRYLARRDSGEYVDLHLREAPDPAQACVDVRRLGATALARLVAAV